MQLRPYQSNIIDQTRNHFRSGYRCVLIESPTGSGKTMLASTMLKTASQRGIPSVFTCHRRELIKQTHLAFERMNIGHGIIGNGFHFSNRPMVQIASVQTIKNKLDKIRKPGLIIMDECFPGYVMVDNKRIDSLSKGELVRTHNGFGKIQHIFKRKTDCVIKIIFKSGKNLVCTPNHPIATAEGFKPAFNLTNNDMVYTIIDYGMHNLRETSESEIMWQSGMQIGMLAENYFELIREARRRDNEVQKDKRNVSTRGEREGINKTTCYEMEAYYSKRKWTSSNYSRVGHSLRSWMELQCNSKYWPSTRQRISYSLQNRCWKYTSENRNRSGWPFTQSYIEENPRQEENQFLGIDWVENIEIHQQRNSSEFERLCPKGIVYNLHVEPNNTYFANNILVHNCHHTPSKTWRKVYEAFPDAYIIGLSATPERLDGSGLGEFFPVMVKGPTVRELIEQGFLSDYKLYAPANIDASQFHTRMGDFISSELAQALDKPTITGDAIKEYQKYASGKRAIVRGVSIEHSKHIAEQFNKAGIPAQHVDGTDSNMRRDIVMESFRKGETLILSNVDLFSEGLDVPAVECVIDLRPTKSLTLWLQFCGRALRPAQGKEFAIIIDHAGNCQRHGLPCDEREWNLEGRTKKPKQDNGPVIRLCPRCFGANQNWRKVCQYCGNEFTAQPREVEKKEGDLVEIDIQRKRKERKRNQAMCRTFDELVEFAEQNNYRNPKWWAGMIIKARKEKEIERNEAREEDHYDGF